MAGLVRRNPGQPEFHQAVREVAETLVPFILTHPEYQDAAILERLTETDRIITFRVTWNDDDAGHCVRIVSALVPAPAQPFRGLPPRLASGAEDGRHGPAVTAGYADSVRRTP